MNKQEINKCTFCNESKPVLRKYIKAGNENLDENLDDNQRAISTIVYYCNDCGLEEKSVKQAILDKILYIGDEIPEGVANDKRPKFVVLGTPQELIDETA